MRFGNKVRCGVVLWSLVNYKKKYEFQNLSKMTSKKSSESIDSLKWSSNLIRNAQNLKHNFLKRNMCLFLKNTLLLLLIYFKKNDVYKSYFYVCFYNNTHIVEGRTA